MDVTNPKQVTPSSTSRPVIVTNRPIIKQDPMMSVAEDANVGELSQSSQPTAPLLEPSKTPIIKPIHISDEPKAKKTDEDEAKADEQAVDPPAEEKPTDDVADDSEPAKKPEPEEQSEESKSEDAETVEADTETKPADEPATDNAEKSTDDPEGDDAKVPAIDDAAVAKEEAAAKQRAEEMQKLIDSRQFYVPVNMVERKRSTRTSVMLIILQVVLTIALIDLMLDANIIELIQKLPHTHFFQAR